MADQLNDFDITPGPAPVNLATPPTFAGGLGGPTLPPTSAPPIADASQAQEFLDNNVNETPQEAILKKLGLRPEDKAKRSKAGNVGHYVKNALLGLLGGVDLRQEALDEYKARQPQLQIAATDVRNADLAKQAQANLEAANWYKQILLKQKQDALEETARRNKANEELKKSAQDIQSRLATGKINQAEARALLDKIKASNEEENGGLSGESGFLYRIAMGDDPETVGKLYGALKAGNAAKLLGRVIPTGSTSTSSQGVDANGNIVTNRATQRQFAANPLAQRLLDSLNLPTLGSNPAGASPTPSGPVLPFQSTGPIAPRVAPAKPTVAPPVSNDIWTEPTSFAGVKNVQEVKDRQKDYSKLKASLYPIQAQRANLANAVANGTADKFTGPLTGTDLAAALRGKVGEIGPNDALGRVLDYESLFGKLGSSVKGSFRNTEIAKADKALGQKTDSVLNTLIVHAANELDTEARMAERSNQFANKHVTAEEATQAAANEIQRYIGELAKIHKMDLVSRAAYVKVHGVPELHTIQQAIDDTRVKKKARSAVTPQTNGGFDIDDIEKSFRNGK